jgi:hypothetical protein
MELDPKYADVIVNRYITHIGADSAVYLIRDGLRYDYQQVVAAVSDLRNVQIPIRTDSCFHDMLS